MDDRTQTIEQIKLLRELQRRKARKTLRDFLPYIGTAYDLRHRELPPEQVPTQEISMQDDKEDLPF